ncbi:hypothetical protein R3P38DRAFT_3592943 [Favolaschia claudopus]|uniref:Uncharacterized protein n=1 Tax=Favolaschia claudopus TaxID=2862362 RepID=A0AAW0AFU6_9AGAR
MSLQYLQGTFYDLRNPMSRPSVLYLDVCPLHPHPVLSIIEARQIDPWRRSQRLVGFIELSSFSLAVAIESAYEQPFGSLKVSADPARYRFPEAEPRERAPALRSRTASLTSSRRVNSRMRAAGAAVCAPCTAGELLVGGEGEAGVEEAVHRFGYDAGGDFGIEGGEGGVGGGEEEGEGGGEVEGAVGADEDAGVEEAEGGGGEAGQGRGEGYGRRRRRGIIRCAFLSILPAHSADDFAAAPRPSTYLTIHRGSCWW